MYHEGVISPELLFLLNKSNPDYHYYYILYNSNTDSEILKVPDAISKCFNENNDKLFGTFIHFGEIEFNGYDLSFDTDEWSVDANHTNSYLKLLSMIKDKKKENVIKLERDRAYGATFGEYDGILFPYFYGLSTYIPTNYQKLVTEKIISQGGSGPYYILADNCVLSSETFQTPYLITKYIPEDKTTIFGIFISHSPIEFGEPGEIKFDIREWSVNLNWLDTDFIDYRRIKYEL